MKILVLYVNVGTLPKLRAEEYSAEIYTRVKKELPSDQFVVCIPVKCGDTRIETLEI